MSEFTPLNNRKQLSKLVAQDIEKAILTKKYSPGAKLLSEKELCNQFNVSRTVVREALQSLSARGLIRIEKGRGVFIEQLSSKTVVDPFYLFLELSSKPEYVYDVLRTRQLIEPPVAGLAALHHTDQDRLNLEKNLSRLRNESDDLEDIANIDMEFHLLLAKSSGNDLMHLILEPIHMLMPRIKVAVIKSVDDARSSAIKWHTKIVQCVLKRDKKAATNAMKEHLLNAEKHMKKMLNQQMVYSGNKDSKHNE